MLTTGAQWHFRVTKAMRAESIPNSEGETNESILDHV